MREDLETREIDDAELDAVSGGVVSISGGVAGAVLADVNGAVGAVTSLNTVQAATGIAGAVPGSVSGITGVQTNAGVAGL
ncbi:hypothetical protein [Streptomyces macrosporus]|uniref:Type A2 lantipeptide n=1 Tax=Streptomyces macrosporus TaxID=44032 RepID=A0ABP5XIT2_9ACTN